MSAVTRVGPGGSSRSPYGNFSDKHSVAITRLGLGGSSRGLYGDFAGRFPNEGEIPIFEATGPDRTIFGRGGGGTGRGQRTARDIQIQQRDLLLAQIERDDEELMVIMEAVLETIQ